MHNVTLEGYFHCEQCEEMWTQINVRWFPGLFIKLIALATLSVFTTVANLFMIYIAFKSKSAVSNTKIFFISLALAHLLGSLVVIPLWIVTRLYVEVALYSPVFCESVSFIWILMILTSFYSLSALSLDRYLIISNPMRYPLKATTSKKLVAIGAVWVFCILFASAPFVGWGEYVFQADAIPICGLNMKHSLSFTIFLIIFGFGAPLCVDIFCCGRIISIARRQSLSIESRKNSDGSTSSIASTMSTSSTTTMASAPHKMSKLKQKLNALRLVFAGTGSFLVCWCPYVGAHIWMITIRKIRHDEESMPYILEFVVMCVALVNGLVNPVVIMVSNRDYRKRIKLVLFNRFGFFRDDISEDRSDGDSSHNNSRRMQHNRETNLEDVYHTAHCAQPEELADTPMEIQSVSDRSHDLAISTAIPTSCVDKVQNNIIVHAHECKKIMSQISVSSLETDVFLDNLGDDSKGVQADPSESQDSNAMVIK